MFRTDLLNQRRRAQWSGSVPTQFIVKLALLLVALMFLPFAATGQDTAIPFRLGFSKSLFSDVNENDAKTSIKVWAHTVAHEHTIQMDPSAQLFDSAAEIAQAMRQGTVDAMSSTFKEYRDVAAAVETGPWFVTKTSGALLEEYILLVHEDAGFVNLDALHGNLLILHDSARMCMATDWLDFIGIRDSLPDGVTTDFKAIKKVDKISEAVLPVFFRQAEACVVAESGFKTMCELNPQLRKKLRVLVKSPPLVPAVMFLRKDFQSSEKEHLLTALRELHTTPAGQQVLTIFQSEALVEIDKTTLNETIAFLDEVDRMRKKRDVNENVAQEEPARVAREAIHD